MQDDVLTVAHVVDAARDGLRLDRFLGSRIVRLSRTRIQTLIMEGQVHVRGQGTARRPSQRVREGQVVELQRPSFHEPPVPRTIELLHHDAHVLVVGKPAGLPVHPNARYHKNTLTEVLRETLGRDHGYELAHRIDRETSGVVVLGQRGHVARTLKWAFASQKVDKRYLAVVHGIITEPMHIDRPIGTALESRIRIKMGERSHEQGGKPAHTYVHPLVYGNFAGHPVTLIEARPKTGRQHQIRVHLAARGHALLGDKLYGLDEQWFIDVVDGRVTMGQLDAHLGLDRQALHAWQVTFAHPGSGEPLTVTAPWPDPLNRIVSLPATP